MNTSTAPRGLTRKGVLATAAAVGAGSWSGLLATCVPAGGTGEPGTLQSGSKVKLTWLVRTNTKENKWEQDIISRWAQVQKASDVELVVVQSSEIEQKKTGLLASGEEVSVWSPAWGSSYVDEVLRGLLHDLTDVIKRDRYDWSDIDSPVYKSYEVKGRQYGMPLLSNLTLFVYNASLWQQAGVPDPPKKWGDPNWTWDECNKRLGRIVKVTEDPTTSIYGTNFNYDIGNQGRSWHGIDYGETGDAWTKDWFTNGIAEKTAWDSPAVLEHLRWRVDLIRQKIMPSPEAASVIKKGGDPFLTGKVAAEFWGDNFFNYKDITSFKWAVAPTPHRPGKAGKSIQFVDNWSIYAKTRYFEQAWQFVKYLASPDGMQSYMLATGLLVPRKSLMDPWIESTGYANKDELKQLVRDVFANSFDSEEHHIAGYGQFWTIIKEEGDRLTKLQEEPLQIATRLKSRIEETAKQVKANVDKGTK